SNIFYGFYFTAYSDIKKPIISRTEHNDKVNYIRTAIKSYSPDISENVDNMIDASLNRFELVKPLKTFDVVVPLKSSSVLNDVIAKRINIKSNVEVIPELIVKNTIKNIKIEIPSEETSEKTKQYVDTIKRRMTSIGDQEFRSKMIPASFRRYVSNYLKFNDKYDRSTFDKINGKNILVIDDTLGEGVTLREIQRLLYQYQPKSIFYFILLIRI
ncbi:MAG: phosphoribosyltransferase, partial [Actinobacteria bacterium]|nr:phosphoribosyltransferase [Actinomycetota bacterium]